ncbi:hypothetical protein CLF_109412 [Clonorchis sinensis]|uniref:Integrase catalytic domain-containing protein n=1 Tax=Clonorchis sinensis TaxID=79923 RepID=G7YJB6_CLOSI|nr:hypothetical protein CLF_109412 [Clonorchis sinensis]
MDWAPAEEALAVEFDTTIGRQEATRGLKTTRMKPGCDPTVFFASLQQSLDRALPGLDGVLHQQLLSDSWSRCSPWSRNIPNCSRAMKIRLASARGLITKRPYRPNAFDLMASIRFRFIYERSLVVGIDSGRLWRFQRQHFAFRKVAAALVDEWSIDNGEGDKELETFQSHFDRLSLNEAGIISWNTTDSYVLLHVIPCVLRRKLIVERHESAHTGYTNTYDLLRQRAYRPKMRSGLMIEDAKGAINPVEPTPVAEMGELWSVDIMGFLLVMTSRKQYIVLMTEHLSRWVKAAAVPNQWKTAISGMVMHHIVANHGVPKMLLTDQGLCFVSEGGLLAEIGHQRTKNGAIPSASNV